MVKHKANVKILFSIALLVIVVSVFFFMFPAMSVNGHFTPITEVDEIINSPLISLFFKLPFKIPTVSTCYYQVPLLLIIPICYLISLLLTIILLADSLTNMFKRRWRIILSFVDLIATVGSLFGMLFSREIIITFAANKFAEPGKTADLIDTLHNNTQLTYAVIAYMVAAAVAFLLIMVGFLIENIEYVLHPSKAKQLDYEYAKLEAAKNGYNVNDNLKTAEKDYDEEYLAKLKLAKKTKSLKVCLYSSFIIAPTLILCFLLAPLSSSNELIASKLPSFFDLMFNKQYIGCITPVVGLLILFITQLVTSIYSLYNFYGMMSLKVNKEKLSRSRIVLMVLCGVNIILCALSKVFTINSFGYSPHDVSKLSKEFSLGVGCYVYIILTALNLCLLGCSLLLDKNLQLINFNGRSNNYKIKKKFNKKKIKFIMTFSNLSYSFTNSRFYTFISPVIFLLRPLIYYVVLSFNIIKYILKLMLKGIVMLINLLNKHVPLVKTIDKIDTTLALCGKKVGNFFFHIMRPFIYYFSLIFGLLKIILTPVLKSVYKATRYVVKKIIKFLRFIFTPLYLILCNLTLKVIYGVDSIIKKLSLNCHIFFLISVPYGSKKFYTKNIHPIIKPVVNLLKIISGFIHKAIEVLYLIFYPIYLAILNIFKLAYYIVRTVIIGVIELGYQIILWMVVFIKFVVNNFYKVYYTIFYPIFLAIFNIVKFTYYIIRTVILFIVESAYQILFWIEPFFKFVMNNFYKVYYTIFYPIYILLFNIIKSIIVIIEKIVLSIFDFFSYLFYLIVDLFKILKLKFKFKKSMKKVIK